MRIFLATVVLLAAPSAAWGGTVSLEGGVLRYAGADSLRVLVAVAEQGTRQGCSAPGEHACVTGGALVGQDSRSSELIAGPGCVRVEAFNGPGYLCEGDVTSVEADFGDEADRLQVVAAGRPLRAGMGGGNDVVSLALEPWVSDVRLDMGAGDDEVAGNATGAATVDFGPGDDRGAINAAQGSTHLGGDGADRLDVAAGAAGVPLVLDGGPGDDVIRTQVVAGVRLAGGDGNDTISVQPPYGATVVPAAGTVPVSCGPGMDHVNEGVLDQLVTHGLGQFDGDVRTGLALTADCPPIPATFPYYLETKARKDRTVRWRITAPEPVKLRIATIGRVQKPYKFARSRRLTAGTNTVTIKLPASVVKLARKSAGADKVGGRIYLRFTLTDSTGERWSFESGGNAVGLRFK